MREKFPTQYKRKRKPLHPSKLSSLHTLYQLNSFDIPFILFLINFLGTSSFSLFLSLHGETEDSWDMVGRYRGGIGGVDCSHVERRGGKAVEL